MNRNLTLFISVLFILLMTPGTKKEQLLLLSKKYFPENYAVLKEYDEKAINEQARGESLKEFIPDVSTIVHEAYHHYQGPIWLEKPRCLDQLPGQYGKLPVFHAGV